MQSARTYKEYSAIPDLHNLRVTIKHALGLSIFTSLILVTELKQSRMERTIQKTPLLLECVSIGSLPSTEHTMDHIENTSPNIFSIAESTYFGCCLELGNISQYIAT